MVCLCLSLRNNDDDDDSSLRDAEQQRLAMPSVRAHMLHLI